jgi:hypothetical protein
MASLRAKNQIWTTEDEIGTILVIICRMIYSTHFNDVVLKCEVYVVSNVRKG